MELKTGLKAIDDFCGGLKGGNLYGLTDLTGCGSASFALTVANKIAESSKLMFFSRIYPRTIENGEYKNDTETSTEKGKK